MLFRYIGDCEKGCVNCFGINFDKGEPVEVTDKHAISKLKANSHFEHKEKGKFKDIAPVDETETSESDEDGDKGGNKGQGSK